MHQRHSLLRTCSYLLVCAATCLLVAYIATICCGSVLGETQTNTVAHGHSTPDNVDSLASQLRHIIDDASVDGKAASSEAIAAEVEHLKASASRSQPERQPELQVLAQEQTPREHADERFSHSYVDALESEVIGVVADLLRTPSNSGDDRKDSIHHQKAAHLIQHLSSALFELDAHISSVTSRSHAISNVAPAQRLQGEERRESPTDTQQQAESHIDGATSFVELTSAQPLLSPFAGGYGYPPQTRPHTDGRRG
jgi:hypothetical protein